MTGHSNPGAPDIDFNSRVASVQKLLVSDTARRLVKREMQQKYVGGADGNSYYKV